MQENIKGEENTMFTNKIGETVMIEVFDNPMETSACLLKVLNGNSLAADLLATEVHKNITIDIGEIPDLPDDINYSDMGIWIDPIGMKFNINL